MQQSEIELGRHRALPLAADRKRYLQAVRQRPRPYIWRYAPAKWCLMCRYIRLVPEDRTQCEITDRGLRRLERAEWADELTNVYL